MATIKKRSLSYQNGKIYKVVNDYDDMIYVGSTTQTLSRRFSCHATKVINQRWPMPLSVAISTHGKEHFQILLIQAFPCTTKDELEAEEYKVMKSFEKAKVYNKMFNGTGSYLTKNQPGIPAAVQKSGVESNRFCRGSIQQAGNRYRFIWYDNKIKKSKTFTFTRGKSAQMALMECRNLQNVTYPFTYLDYAAELAMFNHF
jgi:hypothetical protein